MLTCFGRMRGQVWESILVVIHEPIHAINEKHTVENILIKGGLQIFPNKPFLEFKYFLRLVKMGLPKKYSPIQLLLKM